MTFIVIFSPFAQIVRDRLRRFGFGDAFDFDTYQIQTGLINSYASFKGAYYCFRCHFHGLSPLF